MKFPKIAFFMIFLIMISLSSCQSSPFLLKKPTLGIVSSTPGNTATKTIYQEPSITPSSTSLSSPTFTQPFIPTLPKTEAGKMMLSLLSNNGNCRLPCFWGITPGLSTFQDAQSILFPLNSLSSSATFKFYPDYNSWIGNMSLIYSEKDFHYIVDISVVSFPGINIISEIALNHIEAYQQENNSNSITFPESVLQKISYYSLPHILSEFGPPSSILISTTGGLSSTGQDPLEMVILYSNDGILEYYFTIAFYSGNYIIDCFNNPVQELELYPSGNADNFLNMIAPYWSDRLKPFKPIQYVTNMSISDFYQTFRKPTNKCLSTPITQWPTVPLGG